jgi:hypothetical protein
MAEEEEKSLVPRGAFSPQGRGGNRVETNVPGHGTPGNLASQETRRKRKKKHAATAVEVVDGTAIRLQTEEEGINSLYQWAKRNNTNLGDFWTKLFGRRIPSEVGGEGGGPIFIQFKKFEKEEG